MKKVKCVDNIGFPITIGKIYDLIEENKTHFTIKNDKGEEVSYFKFRFVEIKPKLVPYLTDKQAEAVGKRLAADFGLKRNKNRWQTEGGSFTNKGLARRAARFINDALIDFPE